MFEINDDIQMISGSDMEYIRKMEFRNYRGSFENACCCSCMAYLDRKQNSILSLRLHCCWINMCLIRCYIFDSSLEVWKGSNAVCVC